MEKSVRIQTIVNAPLEKSWEVFTQPEHIMQWNHAGDDWHCPKATNNLEEGGIFSYTMAAKDGSASFDLTGRFDVVAHGEQLDYTLDDGRKVQVHFEEIDGKTLVTQKFEPENQHPVDFQEQGWQAILDNFARHASK